MLGDCRSFHKQWAHPLWLRLVVRGTGLVFLAAGLAKVPIIGTLAGTINQIVWQITGQVTGGSAAFALSAAAAVVLAEIAGGGALVMLRRVRLAAGVLALLTGVFLLVLFQAVVSGHTFPCHCFGVLGVQLSNRAELMLDLGLLNLLLLVIALWPSGRVQWRFAGRAVLLGMAGFALLASEGYLLLRPPAGRRPGNFAAPLLYLRTHLPTPGLTEGPILPDGPTSIPEVASPQGASLLGARPARAALQGASPAGVNVPTMIFLLRFQDFTCPLCFEDFLSLVDSLGARGPLPPGRVWALMKAGGAERLEGTGRLERWAEETGLGFPIMTAPDSIFEAAGVQKSMVAVLADAGRPLFQGEFPIGADRRREALRLLLESGTGPGLQEDAGDLFSRR